MAKLYLFGIGGTGARVMRSLTMLLASGVKAGVDTIIPVLIDPDTSNGDLTRTIDALKAYQSIHSKLTFGTDTKSDFFKTSIDDQGTNYRLQIANVSDKTFGEYIQYNALDKQNKAIINMLFSDKNLNAQMQEGFKGNPNMGSVVLNDFCSPTNNALIDLMQNFQNGDKIFIISSIFGGTGAAGFPLLLNTLRQAQRFNFANPAYIASAPIGALTVLPYFGLKADENSEINMATFVSKAKSALTYYIKNIDTDALYYIADNMTSTYDNVEGSVGQTNDAHFVEMASALAVIDFTNDSAIERGANLYKEFAVDTIANELNLSLLSKKTKEQMATSFMCFYIFAQFYLHHLNNTFEQAWAKARNFTPDMLKNEFHTELQNFINNYLWDEGKSNGWLTELSRNSRSFTPFTLDGHNNIFHSIKGYEPKKIGFGGRLLGNKDGFVLIDDEVAKSSNKLDKRMSDNDYFMNVHWIAINEAIKKRLN